MLPTPSHNSYQSEIARLEKLSKLLDSAFRVPGTNLRFGLDSVIGLIPGLGDAATAAVSCYIVHRAHQLGVDRLTLVKMLGNIGVDLLVGTVPLVGDLFDAGWKCNTRNLKLLQKGRAQSGAARHQIHSERKMQRGAVSS